MAAYGLTTPDLCRTAALGCAQELQELRQRYGKVYGSEHHDPEVARAILDDCEEVQRVHTEAVRRLHAVATGSPVDMAPYIAISTAIQAVLRKQVGRTGYCTTQTLLRETQRRCTAFSGPDAEIFRVARRLGYRTQRVRDDNGVQSRVWVKG